MHFTMWDTLFNLVALLFWFRLWVGHDRNILFNVYLAPVCWMSERVIRVLRPAFGRLPAWVIGALLTVFLLVIKALVVPQHADWVVRFGFETRTVDTTRLITCLAFSALSFAIFLFKLWGLSMIYAGGFQARTFAQASSGLYHAARPFSLLRPAIKPVVLLGFGLVIAILINRIGGWQNPPTPMMAGRVVISSLAGFVDILAVVLSLLMLLIIGSWVALFSGSPGMMAICNDWISLILGPIRRYPMHMGSIDLSPLIFFFVVQWFIYPFLKGILLLSYNGLS